LHGHSFGLLDFVLWGRGGGGVKLHILIHIINQKQKERSVVVLRWVETLLRIISTILAHVIYGIMGG
jgi:hypothetical protein